MLIPMNKLAEAIRSHMGIKEYNVGARIIRNIKMFPLDYALSDGPLDPDTCYVCDFRKLRYYDPQTDFPPLICVVEPEARNTDIFFNNRSVIAIYGTLIADVMAELSDITYQLGGRSSSLNECIYELSHCSGIQNLLNAGVRMLGNPLILLDCAQRLVACADSSAISRNFLNNISKMEYQPCGIPFFDPQRDPLQHIDYPEITKIGDQNLAVMGKALYSGGAPVGYLNMFRFDRDFCEDDEVIFNLLGTLLAAELRNRKIRAHADEHSEQIIRFFSGIIENDPDPEAVLREQKQIGVKLKRYLTVMVIYVRSADIIPGLSYSEIAGMLASSLPDTYGMMFRKSIMLISSSDRPVTNYDQFLSPVRTILDEYQLIVGISSSFENVIHLREHAFYCCKALQLGTVLHPDRVIYPYREYAIYYMAELCLKNNDISAFCLPAVNQLLARSEEDNADLLETLRTYFRLGLSKTNTAREMNIHVNTVKYRLQQIQKITGLEIDRDDNALRLMLSFRLMEYREKFQKYETTDFLRRE